MRTEFSGNTFFYGGDKVDLVSIIVPVYNVEDYLERCINSILNQSLNEIEVLLINDGSKDLSGEICETFKNRDSRVKVFHKDNGGVSSARNFGIEHASGKYLAFIDPDDWVEAPMFETLLKSANEQKSDLVVCDYQNVYEDGNILPSSKELTGEVDVLELKSLGYVRYIVDYFLPNKHGYYVWNKLYKKEIVDKYNLRFDKNVNYAEDFLFNLEYLCHTNKISLVPKVFTNYFKRTGSLSKYPDLLFTRLIDLSLNFKNYGIKSHNSRNVNKVFPPLLLSHLLNTLDYLPHIDNKEYVMSSLNELDQSPLLKFFAFRLMIDKECSNLLKARGYSLKGRIFLKSQLFMTILGYKSNLVKYLIK